MFVRASEQIESISHLKTLRQPKKSKPPQRVRCCCKISNCNKRNLSRSAVLVTLLATSKPALEIRTFWSWIWPRPIIVGAGFQSMDFITDPWNSKGLRFHVLVRKAAMTCSRFYNSLILTTSRVANSFLKVPHNFPVKKILPWGIFFPGQNIMHSGILQALVTPYCLSLLWIPVSLFVKWRWSNTL